MQGVDSGGKSCALTWQSGSKLPAKLDVPLDIPSGKTMISELFGPVKEARQIGGDSGNLALGVRI